MKLSKLLVLALVLVLAMTAVAVNAQDDEEDMEMVELAPVDPLLVEGDIVTAGSSTVGPLTQAMIERFEEGGYGGTVTLDIIGSGGGFERFCVAAETDISNASRVIESDEVEACEGNDRFPVPFRVGTDALAVTVSETNDFVGEDGLTIEQLQFIFSNGSDVTWADVPGAGEDWPAEAIQLFSPGTDSGTFDFFVEALYEGLAEEEGVEDPAEYILNAGGIQLSEDDNVLVNGVSDSPFAIGYFGYAYYLENQDILTSLPINGVAPSQESVEAVGDDAYPLARPLFIYGAPSIMQEKAQVASFISYYLQNVNEIVIEVGYFPASDAALNGARMNWMIAMGEMEGEYDLYRE